MTPCPFGFSLLTEKLWDLGFPFGESHFTASQHEPRHVFSIIITEDGMPTSELTAFQGSIPDGARLRQMRAGTILILPFKIVGFFRSFTTTADPKLFEEPMERIENLEVQVNSLKKRLGKAAATIAGMLQLSDCAKLRKRELSRKRDDFTLFLPRDWLWPPQREEPLSLRELPEIELRTAKMRLQAARILHLVDLLLIG